MLSTITIRTDNGPGKDPHRAQADHTYDPRSLESAPMTPFLFPTAVAMLMFGSWIALVGFEPCVLQQRDPKFDCWGSLLFTASFASIGSLLTGLIALLARVMLYSFLTFETKKLEWVSALLASLLLTGLSYSVIRWDINFGDIGTQLFSWLGVSFVVCGVSLMIVKHVVMREIP